MSEPLFQRLSRFLLVALCFLAPLAFWVRLDDTYDLPKLTLLYLGVSLWLGLASARLASSGELTLARTPVEAPLAALALLLLVSSGRSWDRDASLWGLYGHYMFGAVPLLACAALFLASAAALRTASAQLDALRALLAAAALASLYAALQYQGWEPFARVGRSPGGQPWATFGNPLYLGSFLAMAALASAGLALGGESAPRTGYALLAAAFAAALGLTGSRSAWLGLGAGLAALAAMAAAARVGRGRWAAALALPLAAAVLTAFASPHLRARLAAVRAEGAASARVAGWVSGLRIAREHPLLGTGPDTFLYAFPSRKNEVYHRAAGPGITHAHAHNELIQWAATTGWLGLGLYLWLLAAAGRASWSSLRASPRPELTAAALAALAGLWAQSLLNFSSIGTSALAAILAGAALAPGSRPAVLRLPGAFARLAAAGLLALAASGGAVGALRSWRADAQFKTALGDLAAGNRLSAARRMERAVALKGGVSLYRARLGSVYRELAERAADPAGKRRWLDRALHHAREDAARHPGAPDAHNNLGVLLMHRGRALEVDHREEALEAFRLAVRLDPWSAEIWANLARMAHFFVQDSLEARLWREALELDPRHAAARQALDRLEARARKRG